MNAIGEIIKLSDMARVLSEVSGKKVNTPHMTREEFYDPELPKKVGPELWENMDIFYKKYVNILHGLRRGSILRGENGSLTVITG